MYFHKTHNVKGDYAYAEIEAVRHANDYNKEQLAQMLRMSRSTLWNRLNNPAEFRVCELTALHDILKFSDEERHILL